MTVIGGYRTLQPGVALCINAKGTHDADRQPCSQPAGVHYTVRESAQRTAGLPSPISRHLPRFSARIIQAMSLSALAPASFCLSNSAVAPV